MSALTRAIAKGRQGSNAIALWRVWLSRPVLPDRALDQFALAKAQEKVPLIGAAIAHMDVFELLSLGKPNRIGEPMGKNSLAKSREYRFKCRFFSALQPALQLREVKSSVDDLPGADVASPASRVRRTEFGPPSA